MQYKQGTVTTENGNPVIIGHGTQWLGEINAGDLFAILGGQMYVVASVSSDTQLNLTAPFQGNNTEVEYGITRDFTQLGIPLMSRGDINTPEIFSRAMMLIDEKLRGL